MPTARDAWPHDVRWKQKAGPEIPLREMAQSHLWFAFRQRLRRLLPCHAMVDPLLAALWAERALRRRPAGAPPPWFRRVGGKVAPCRRATWRENPPLDLVRLSTAGEVQVVSAFTGLDARAPGATTPPLVYETIALGGPSDGTARFSATAEVMTVAHEQLMGQAFPPGVAVTDQTADTVNVVLLDEAGPSFIAEVVDRLPRPLRARTAGKARPEVAPEPVVTDRLIRLSNGE